jgi:hypothetical protein
MTIEGALRRVKKEKDEKKMSEMATHLFSA